MPDRGGRLYYTERRRRPKANSGTKGTQLGGTKGTGEQRGRSSFRRFELRPLFVRIILIGYSWGETRAVIEADKLYNAITQVLRMKAEIDLVTIDGVDYTKGTQDKPLANGPKAPLRSFKNRFTNDEWHGGHIDGATDEGFLKGTTHVQADRKVLLNEAFQQWIAERELATFDGDPLGNMP